VETPRREGEVSTGSMIPVHDASSEGDARAVVSLLEAHEIPALLDLDLDGAVLPWRRSADQRVIEVLVPSSMVGKATEVLHRHDYSTIGGHARTRFRIRFASSLAAPAAHPAPQTFEARPDTEIDEDDDEDTGPIDLPLPEPPSPLNSRLLGALAAIGVGAALQRILESMLGPREVVMRFAAKAPITEEPWRLITAGFIHGSLGHFVSNGAFGLLIGVVLFGTHLFGATALVWVIASIVGLASEAVLSPAALIVGASAGNYGLVGLWASGQMQRAKVTLLPRRERIRTIGVLLLLVPGALTPFSSSGTKVAVIAHVAGFLTGGLLGFFFERRLVPARFGLIEERSRVALMAVLALVGLGFLFAGLSLR
jgi:membrane associated rhomboid family serine protease